MANSAYDLIGRLRPEWLRLRGRLTLSGSDDLVVYLDNARMGGRESLRGIAVNGIEIIHYFDPAEATLRWGTGHGSGVILVSTVAELE